MKRLFHRDQAGSLAYRRTEFHFEISITTEEIFKEYYILWELIQKFGSYFKTL